MITIIAAAAAAAIRHINVEFCHSTTKLATLHIFHLTK